VKVLAMVCSFGLGILGLSSALEAKVLQGPVLALQETGVSKEDLKKLLAVKISDTTIIAYIRSHAPAPKLSAEDLVDLKAAGASSEVLAAMVEASAAKAPPAPSENYTTPSYSYDSSVPYGTTPSSYAYYDGYPYYPYYPYGYAYPYYGFGFGVSFPFYSHHHDDHFHHFDNHSGHLAPHDFRSGQVPHGTFHGGSSGGGAGHGGGAHGGGGGHH